LLVAFLKPIDQHIEIVFVFAQYTLATTLGLTDLAGFLPHFLIIVLVFAFFALVTRWRGTTRAGVIETGYAKHGDRIPAWRSVGASRFGPSRFGIRIGPS
jgi:hypothetical protein